MFADMIPGILILWTFAPPFFRRSFVHPDPSQDAFVTLLCILVLYPFTVLNVFLDEPVVPVLNNNLKGPLPSRFKRVIKVSMLYYVLRQRCHMLVHDDIDQKFEFRTNLPEKVFVFQNCPKAVDDCI
jgi:hypothetical protein